MCVCVEYRLRINILRKTCDRFYEAGNITKGKLLMFTLDSKVSNDEKNKQIKQQKKSNKSRLMNKSGCGAFFVMFFETGSCLLSVSLSLVVLSYLISVNSHVFCW